MASWACSLIVLGCLLSGFTLFVRRLPGKGWTVVAFQCAACLGSSLEMQHNQRAGGDLFPKAAELKRSWYSWCLICMWNVKPRLLLPGSAGFRSHGVFLKCKWQKASCFSGKAFLSQEKLYPTKRWQLSTLTDLRVQAETCLVSCRAKPIREF